MITAQNISIILGFPIKILITGNTVALMSLNGSTVEPWHQTYAQKCWDAGQILPYDEAKAEQLYEWEQAGVPLQVTRRQLLLELFITDGVEEDDIYDAINNIADTTTRKIATIEFKQALHFERDNPFVEQIGGLLGLSEGDIDERFKSAILR